MSLLSELKPILKSTSSKKRIGRGNSSGWGTTAARGYKGQKARSGSKRRATFEGGQMPLWQRLPKFGFTPLNKVKFHIVSLDRIIKLSHQSLDKNEQGIYQITPDILQKFGLIRKQNKPIKILCGLQPVQQAFHAKVHALSRSARVAIEKAGGKIEIINS